MDSSFETSSPSVFCPVSRHIVFFWFFFFTKPTSYLSLSHTQTLSRRTRLLNSVVLDDYRLLIFYQLLQRKSAVSTNVDSGSRSRLTQWAPYLRLVHNAWNALNAHEMDCFAAITNDDVDARSWRFRWRCWLQGTTFCGTEPKAWAEPLFAIRNQRFWKQEFKELNRRQQRRKLHRFFCKACLDWNIFPVANSCCRVATRWEESKLFCQYGRFSVTQFQQNQNPTLGHQKPVGEFCQKNRPNNCIQSTLSRSLLEPRTGNQLVLGGLMLKTTSQSSLPAWVVLQVVRKGVMRKKNRWTDKDRALKNFQPCREKVQSRGNDLTWQICQYCTCKNAVCRHESMLTGLYWSLFPRGMNATISPGVALLPHGSAESSVLGMPGRPFPICTPHQRTTGQCRKFPETTRISESMMHLACGLIGVNTRKHSQSYLGVRTKEMTTGYHLEYEKPTGIRRDSFLPPLQLQVHKKLTLPQNTNSFCRLQPCLDPPFPHRGHHCVGASSRFAFMAWR